ncbi:MAG TPA: hypothetical protein VMJ66_13350 [Geobacteraceae bacterium]|nr:hypothetical protein [Geobacteraceae bacterium]
MIPRRLQILLRRGMVLRKRRRSGDIWPIDAAAASPPENWRGWPDGKRFALVLTHDVDRIGGVLKCRQLMGLEAEMGFRSSFYFVAGDYHVIPGLREEMEGNGFEVGVHGWTHDGSLYKSRMHFMDQARRINERLAEWGAVGFRSPAMHHNLDWLRDLDIEYDLSTFDTDPFEPQSDGVRTIFPFRVEGREPRWGYIEMPYTLVQDFTLFVLMGEKTIDIWKRKLDWIAEQGGMALLNAHPDYMNFNGTGLGLEEYPASNYQEFLGYVRDRYNGMYWHPLPREIAAFWKASLTDEAKPQIGGRIVSGDYETGALANGP